MKFIGWVMSAGMVAAATGAMAQPLTPGDIRMPAYSLVSDVGGPYAAMPPEAPPRYAPEGYAPLLPPREVYAVLRENGYSPLGIPQQRGMYYTIAAINLDGDDGRLVIDARNGRLVRFIPAWRMGDLIDDDEIAGTGAQAALPRPPELRPVPRPPLAVPRVASRAVPLPRPLPPRAVAEPKQDLKPLAAQPAPARQSAAVTPRPETPAAAPAAPTTEAKPSPTRPSQGMPPVQGLE
jgi:hypothetical protein